MNPNVLPTTSGLWIGGEVCCPTNRFKGMIKVPDHLVLLQPINTFCLVLEKNIIINEPLMTKYHYVPATKWLGHIVLPMSVIPK